MSVPGKAEAADISRDPRYPGRAVRRVTHDGVAFLLVAVALAGLFYAVLQLRGHDYVAAVLLIVAAMSVLRAGVELLRPTVGE